MSWYVQKAKWSPRSVAEYYFPEYFPEYFAEYFAEWINILSAPTLLKTRMGNHYRAKLRTAFVENAYGRRVSIETRMSISFCFFFIPLGVLLKTRMGKHHRAKLRTTGAADEGRRVLSRKGKNARCVASRRGRDVSLCEGTNRSLRTYHKHASSRMMRESMSNHATGSCAPVRFLIPDERHP